MSRSQDKITQYYNRYCYLSNEYANKVFNYSNSGYEKDDIVQEMNIKVYMSIVGYAKQWKEYRETGQRKPAPMEFWIRTALANKVKDFIRKFNLVNVHNAEKISIGEEDNSVDVGIFSTAESVIDLEKNICIINGVDLLGKLKGDRKQCYIKYLAGYTITALAKEYENINVKNLIEKYNQYLAEHQKRNLFDFRVQRFQTFHSSEE